MPYTPGPWHKGHDVITAGVGMELSTVCQRCSSVENQHLIAAAPDLLEACMATMRYWWWCAQSANDSEEEANHPGCHLSSDTQELQSLCNEAAELVAKAVQDAGVTVLHGLPIRETDFAQPLSDETLRQLRPMMEDGLKQAVEDGALEPLGQNEEPADDS